MKTPASLRSAAAVILVLVSACSKSGVPSQGAQGGSAAQLVTESERSPHFDAVNSHLELGGQLYGFVDIDGDVLALAGSAQTLVTQIASVQPQLSAVAKQDFKALVSDLGLTDVKAVGLSSVRQSDGIYRNRTFLYTPEGRHGLFAIFGGPPAKFENARLAPADADVFAEHEFDMVAVYETVKAVVTKINGPEAAQAFEKTVKAAGSQAHFSLFDLIEGLRGRVTFIVKMDPAKNVATPGPNSIQIPAFSALIRIDGIGSAVEAALADPSMHLEASQEGSLHVFTVKTQTVDGIKPVLAVDGKTLYAATSSDFFHECLRRTSGLDANPAFVSALAALGPEGNGLTWVTPAFFSRIKGLSSINPQAAPQMKKILDIYAANLPTATQPLLSLRTNLPDGILIRSTWNRSLKADVAMLTVYNPLTVGLIAAMAVPAYQKVKINSQAIAITNNLRALSAAADQYYLEKGVNTATYNDLVGPDKAVKAIVPVAGEDYTAIRFIQGLRLQVRLPDGRVFSYPSDRNGPRQPGPNAPGAPGSDDVYNKIRIVHNLRTLELAANRYYQATGATTVTYEQLMAMDPHPDVQPVLGEDYKTVVFEKGVPSEVRLPDGRVVRNTKSPAHPVRAANINAPAAVMAQPAPAEDPILDNLRQLDDAANQYYTEHDTTTVTFDQLVGPGNLIREIKSVRGEDYRSILFKKGRPLRLYLKDGGVISYPP